MSVNITKNPLLVFFIKIDSYNYKFKTCNKVYKTPNGGIGHFRTYYLTHLKDPSDKVVLSKRKLQIILLPALPNTETF
ncbi:zinc finger BED domain-containing protein 4-like [Aphis craccivora]|uniref:Zinc finger BED domain-containing protein 4-like n=1 Tax=Aphis craccivora TaxID=307492 RepID=A0A6G0VQR1_APHCR|nr:zinc finger BED domain-containing protein 4-like [Aphis craccivora]